MREVVYHSHLHGCLFIILISLFLNRCCCVDQQYEACVPRNCGNKNISFPFFIAGVQPPYCGSPGYNITCVNNTLSFLQLPEYNQDLLVDEIFYDNRSLRVSNGALRSNAESCEAIRQIARNLTVRSDHFEYINDSRLELLWNCNFTDAKLDRYKVSCDDISFLVMKGNDPNLASVASCKIRAEAPVTDDDQVVTGSNFSTLMRRGFVLKWRAPDCRECKLTGGRCGFDIELDQFLCFCSDRPHYRNCTAITTSTSPGGNQQSKKNSSTVRGVIIATSLIFAVALLCSITCISYRRVVAQGKDRNINESQTLRLHDNEHLMDHGDQFGEDDKKDITVPFFELEIILEATDNFSEAHKLGQGGFGPVYKGKFPGGEEIAVKRLSSNSGQGLVEFKNEVVLIAKLQHRNLVRLLGYCIKANERILLYEYMPNKSLDVFIFDEKLRMLLNWATRFDIIAGVARGLLYLHQDSRLRIIHRDMKASNILLDEEMNPKISDFGLARIVERKETESNTTRVMGTYGYMAPEYAVEGQFSVKSDAFSFGVVVLEIISGKKNTGFFNSQLALSLLGYVWSLWEEGKPMILLDETLVGACNTKEVLKCIVIGLLCVQEDPNDRPNMSKVVTMLSSETETIPNPKQPAFVTRKRFNGRISSSSTKPETQSKNEITLSEVHGR